MPCVDVPADNPSAPLVAAVGEAAGSETRDADGAGAGYVAVLRAALSRAAPPTAVATVMAWLQVIVAKLRNPVPTALHIFAADHVRLCFSRGTVGVVSEPRGDVQACLQ